MKTNKTATNGAKAETKVDAKVETKPEVKSDVQVALTPGAKVTSETQFKNSQDVLVKWTKRDFDRKTKPGKLLWVTYLKAVAEDQKMMLVCKAVRRFDKKMVRLNALAERIEKGIDPAKKIADRIAKLQAQLAALTKAPAAAPKA